MFSREGKAEQKYAVMNKFFDRIFLPADTIFISDQSRQIYDFSRLD